MTTLRQGLRATTRRISWLARDKSQKLLALLVLGADSIWEAHRLAVKAGWLRTPNSPPDALPLVADESMLERAPAETDVQHRARLLGRWDIWEQAGTPSWAAEALEPIGVDPSLVTVKYWPDTDWEPFETANWSTWWVILQPPLPWSLDTWGDGLWDDAGTWGTTATPSEVAAVRQFLGTTKAGHELGIAAILDFDADGGDTWGLGTWGSGTWGDDVVVWWMGQLWGQYGQPGVWGDVHPLHAEKTAKWGGKII